MKPAADQSVQKAVLAKPKSLQWLSEAPSNEGTGSWREAMAWNSDPTNEKAGRKEARLLPFWKDEDSLDVG